MAISEIHPEPNIIFLKSKWLFSPTDRPHGNLHPQLFCLYVQNISENANMEGDVYTIWLYVVKERVNLTRWMRLFAFILKRNDVFVVNLLT